MMVFGLIEIRGTMQCSKKPLITNVLFATIYSLRFNRDDLVIYARLLIQRYPPGKDVVRWRIWTSLQQSLAVSL